MEVRAASLSERVVLDVPGNVFKRAMVLGDADNDPQHDNELVVGTLEGSLFVFKGPSRLCGDSGLGTIIGISVSDALNEGRNVVTVATAEGRCYVFRVENGSLRKVALLRIPPNVSALLVDDVDGDGLNELVLGTTDHLVYAFAVHFAPSAEESAVSSSSPPLTSAYSSSLKLAPPANSPPLKSSMFPNPSSSSSPPVLSLTPGPEMGATSEHQSQQHGVPMQPQPQPQSPMKSTGEYSSEWTLMLKTDWVVDGQIESLAVTRDETGNPESTTLLVGMLCEAEGPGKAHYLTIHKGAIERNTIAEGIPEKQQQATTATATAANKYLNRKTDVVAPLGKPGTFAVSSFHGDITVKCIHGSDGGHCCTGEWVQCVPDIPILATTHANVLGDGHDNLVVCSWSGTTYVIDTADGRAIVVPFGQPVRAFTAGQFSTSPGKSSTCFVYATFHEGIVVHNNVSFPSVVVPTLLDMMRGDLQEACRALSQSKDGKVRDEELLSLLRTGLRCPFAATTQFQRYRSKLQSQVDVLRKKI